jgi:hypothetical protein|tara:strand:+ start:211 stop:477 length:267 start_codon:yes stop_codon:yes gene_type:complete
VTFSGRVIDQQFTNSFRRSIRTRRCLLHNITNLTSCGKAPEDSQSASEHDFVKMIRVSACFEKSQHAPKVLIDRVFPIRFGSGAHDRR